MHAAGQMDRYRELRRLGSGGMGEVVLAEDTALGRKVALKRLRASDDAPELGRLRREALVGASLNHPNLVAVYDALLEEEDLVIVMEYVEGQTLSAALAGGALPPPRALAIVSAVAAALDHVHARNVVHRDVKPANILLGVGGVVKLGDLGIASAADRTRITSIGTVLGTIPYMAPEQLEPSRPTPAVDVYALGAVAFEALGGRRARNETNPLALAHALATQPAPNLREVWPDAPSDAAAVLAMAMARDPTERPRSAGELAGRLQAALSADPSTAPLRRPSVEPAAAAGRRSRPAATAPRSLLAERRINRHLQRPAALLAIGLVAALAAVIAIAAASRGGGNNSPKAANASSAATAPQQRRSGAATSPAAAGASPTALGKSSGPVVAVESFYKLAAAHRFAAAWALADPTFRAQLQGLRSFSAQQSAVRSITFDSTAVTAASATSATVAVRTTPVLDSGVQHCGGTVQVSRPAGSWLLHRIAIQC